MRSWLYLTGSRLLVSMPAALARYASGNVTEKLECGDPHRLEVGFAKVRTVQIKETRCSRSPRSFLLVRHAEVIARCRAEMSDCHSRRWKVLARNRTIRVICPLAILLSAYQSAMMIGRGGGDRTHDLRLKRPLLYH